MAGRGDRLAIKKLAKRYANAGLDPSALGSLQNQATGLYTQYRDSKALLGLDWRRLKSQFRQQRSDLRQQGRLDLSTAAGAANDRGVLGSTSDVSARATVKGNTASAIIQARDALQQGQQANIAQRQTVERDLYAGLSGLEAQRTAQKTAAGIDAYGNNLYDYILDQANGGGGNGNGNGGGGNPGAGSGGNAADPGTSWKQVHNQKDKIQALLHELANAAAAGQYGPYTQEADLTRIWKNRNRNRVALGADRIPLQKLIELMQLAKNPSTTAGGKPLPS